MKEDIWKGQRANVKALEALLNEHFAQIWGKEREERSPEAWWLRMYNKAQANCALEVSFEVKAWQMQENGQGAVYFQKTFLLRHLFFSSFCQPRQERNTERKCVSGGLWQQNLLLFLIHSSVTRSSPFSCSRDLRRVWFPDSSGSKANAVLDPGTYAQYQRVQYLLDCLTTGPPFCRFICHPACLSSSLGYRSSSSPRWCQAGWPCWSLSS